MENSSFVHYKILFQIEAFIYYLLSYLFIIFDTYISFDLTFLSFLYKISLDETFGCIASYFHHIIKMKGQN